MNQFDGKKEQKSFKQVLNNKNAILTTKIVNEVNINYIKIRYVPNNERKTLIAIKFDDHCHNKGTYFFKLIIGDLVMMILKKHL